MKVYQRLILSALVGCALLSACSRKPQEPAPSAPSSEAGSPSNQPVTAGHPPPSPMHPGVPLRLACPASASAVAASSGRLSLRGLAPGLTEAQSMAALCQGYSDVQQHSQFGEKRGRSFAGAQHLDVAGLRMPPTDYWNSVHWPKFPLPELEVLRAVDAAAEALGKEYVVQRVYCVDDRVPCEEHPNRIRHLITLHFLPDGAIAAAFGAQVLGKSELNPPPAVVGSYSFRETPAPIKDVIDTLLRTYGDPQLVFVNDNYTSGQQYAVELVWHSSKGMTQEFFSSRHGGLRVNSSRNFDPDNWREILRSQNTKSAFCLASVPINEKSGLNSLRGPFATEFQAKQFFIRSMKEAAGLGAKVSIDETAWNKQFDAAITDADCGPMVWVGLDVREDGSGKVRQQISHVIGAAEGKDGSFALAQLVTTSIDVRAVESGVIDPSRIRNVLAKEFSQIRDSVAAAQQLGKQQSTEAGRTFRP